MYTCVYFPLVHITIFGSSSNITPLSRSTRILPCKKVIIPNSMTRKIWIQQLSRRLILDPVELILQIVVHSMNYILKTMLIKLILFYYIFQFCDGISRCSRSNNKPIKSDYYLMQTCTSSTKNIIAQTHAEELDHCKNFAARYKGLAFNFAEPGK